MTSNRFKKGKKLAWERTATLSHYGEQICRTKFDDVKLDDYDVEVSAFEDVHECMVRNRAGGPVHEVIIPTTPDEYGSRFGACSCGVHKTKTIPCVHMIAATKSSKIPGLTSINVMPSWCYTAVWREQFGQEASMHCGFDMQYLKDHYQPNPKARYCPKVAAAAKSGRKKNMKRFKSPLEEGGKKKGGRKKKSKVAPKATFDVMNSDNEGEDGRIGIL